MLSENLKPRTPPIKIPEAVYQGIGFTLNALHNEVSAILYKTDSPWKRIFRTSEEEREIPERKTKEMHRILRSILPIVISIDKKYRFDRLSGDITRLSKKLQMLTEISKETQASVPQKYIDEWNTSSVGKEVNVLDDIFLRWLEMAWIACQKEVPIRLKIKELPDLLKHFLDIANFIDQEKESWMDRAKSFFYRFFGGTKSYTKTFFKRIDIKNIEECEPAEKCKEVIEAIHEWRGLLSKGPETEKMQKWRWLAASYEALLEGVHQRYDAEIREITLASARRMTQLYERKGSLDMGIDHSDIPKKNRRKTLRMGCFFRKKKAKHKVSS